MSPRVVVLVQARMGSRRLPQKSLRILQARPMIIHVLERASALGHDVCLATSMEASDELLAATVADAGYHVFRGSESDVLDRMASAARHMSADVVMRVTGDCPLLAPDVCAAVLGLWLEHEGIATNDTTCSGWPDGTDVEVFSAAVLQLAAVRATKQGHREHVTPWIRRVVPHRVLTCDEDWRAVKLSVDDQSDFERVAGVMRYLPARRWLWSQTRQAYLAYQKESVG